MGLDTTHGCFHGPYGAFKRFREDVADAAEAHYGYRPDLEAHPFRAFQGWWDWPAWSDEPGHHPLTEPLDVFFIHSDCDGWIFPEHAGVLADRLEPLVGYLDDASRDRLWEFIRGLRDAHETGEVVAFR